MKTIYTSIVLAMVCCCANAEYVELNDALRATYENCVGIDDALHDMKVRAGINTAVTGVGTGLGIGATAVGIAKANVDKAIEEKLASMRSMSYGASPDVVVVGSTEFMAALEQQLQQSKSEITIKEVDAENPLKKALDAENERITAELTQKSKRLGNWRTGLIAGNTVTNVAGAIIASKNKVDKSLQEQIDGCIKSVRNLQNSIVAARINGEDVTEAQKIHHACAGFEYIDTSKINNRATGSMVSSIVGSGTGLAGTITSIMANSDKVRSNDTPEGIKKEKNLNTAANVLSAGSAVASATATVFNASQIKAIKDVAKVAEQCTEVLK